MRPGILHKITAALLVLSTSGLTLSAANEKIVEISVEVTEVNNRKASDFGVEWIDKLQLEEASILSPEKIGRFVRTTKIAADVKMLLEKNAAEVLANPKLITNNGTQATFHAGGEIPYVTTSSLGSGNVEFKPYGITLEIKPAITRDDYINTEIKAGVSSPDETTAVTLAGIKVPGLLEREVTSIVTIKSGTLVTLAGLVQSRRETETKGIPILAEIPVIGRLFSHKRNVNNKTTVVIFITPTILSE